MRLVVVAALVFLAPLAWPQATEMTIFLQGTPAGTSTFERMPDGSFVAKSQLTLGTLKFQSSVRGRYEGDTITEFAVDANTPGGTTKISYKAGTIDVDRAGTKASAKYTISGPNIIGNLHPQFAGAMLAGIPTDQKEPLRVNALVIDAGIAIYLQIMPKEPRTIDGRSVRLFAVTFGPVEAEFALFGRDIVGFDVPSQQVRFVQKGFERLFDDPLAKFPELSQPVFEIMPVRETWVRMRDGVRLATDLHLPKGDGPFPVILMRTPYGKAAVGAQAPFYVARGYAVVVQDCRGRERSEGEWDPFVNEGIDGYDTLSWIERQRWSTGEVGMIGGSYGGFVQWATAVKGHPALKCIVPQVSPPDAMRNLPYDHGTFFLLGNLWWSRIVSDRRTDLASTTTPFKDPNGVLALPLSQVDDKTLGRNVPFWDKWLSRDSIQEWKGFDYTRKMRRVTVPAIQISGWFDGNGIGTRINWQSQRRKPNQFLIYGPWTHAFNTTRSIGSVNFGAEAILELDSMYLRWFDHWLKGKSVGLNRKPRVKVFETGANKWHTGNSFPVRNARPFSLYLGAGDKAPWPTYSGTIGFQNVGGRDASFTFDPNKVTFKPEDLVVDPLRATLSVELPKDRTDVLVFQTPPLVDSVSLSGPLEFEGTLQTSAEDTDIFLSILDTDPKGVHKMFGMGGKLRLAYRDGMGEPKRAVPGRSYRVRFPIWDMFHRFEKGHRITVLMSVSAFPMFARNLGTVEPRMTAERMVVQNNTLKLDRRNPAVIRGYRVRLSGQ